MVERQDNEFKYLFQVIISRHSTTFGHSVTIGVKADHDLI